MIRTNYDPEADVLHVAFGPEHARTDGAIEVAPGVYLELDDAGNAIAIEVTSARRRAGNAVSLSSAAAA